MAWLADASEIDRAAEVAGGGGPSLSLLKMIIANGIHPAKSGKNRSNPNKADSKQVNAAWSGVASDDAF